MVTDVDPWTVNFIKQTDCSLYGHRTVTVRSMNQTIYCNANLNAFNFNLNCMLDAFLKYMIDFTRQLQGWNGTVKLG